MANRRRDSNEGPVIFATPDKALASVFLVDGHSDEWMRLGYYDDVLVVVIRSNREDFIKRDHGGSLYTVPSDNFLFYPDRGMREKEWTSTMPAQPGAEERCPSALDAMIDNGAQVYFVDGDVFASYANSIRGTIDHGLGILKGLVSENQHRRKNVAPLPEWT